MFDVSHREGGGQWGQSVAYATSMRPDQRSRPIHPGKAQHASCTIGGVVDDPIAHLRLDDDVS